jgi:hypothetical protein
VAGQPVPIEVRRFDAQKNQWVKVAGTKLTLSSLYTYKPGNAAKHELIVKYAGDAGHKPSQTSQQFRVIR